jgi:hypothetical protein
VSFKVVIGTVDSSGAFHQLAPYQFPLKVNVLTVYGSGLVGVTSTLATGRSATLESLSAVHAEFTSEDTQGIIQTLRSLHRELKGVPARIAARQNSDSKLRTNLTGLSTCDLSQLE